MSKLLEARELTKSYASGRDRLIVFRNIALTVEKGELLGIIGVSGVGKSTLLNLLGALDRPDSGHIVYKGKDILQFSDRELAAFRNSEIGFVFQFHHLLPEFTALENVMMPAIIGGERKISAKKRALELLAAVGLADRSHHKPAELSGGEKQRVAGVRALIESPAMLLADEPTGNLDRATSESVFRYICSLREQSDVAAIIATHNLEMARECDRILQMEDSRLVPCDAL